MKKIGFISAVFLNFSSSSFAGQYVEKSMYVPHHIAVGVGKTRALAEKDALSAVPKISDELFFEPDSDFHSPAFQCLGEGLSWNEKSECQGADLQMIIPLRKVSR